MGYKPIEPNMTFEDEIKFFKKIRVKEIVNMYSHLEDIIRYIHKNIGTAEKGAEA